MVTRRYLVGGPANSGKSTFILSATRRLNCGLGKKAKAVEFDVWSQSYPAFEGQVSFKAREKRFGLEWDWKTPLDERLADFRGFDGDLVFGDLPGAKIDEATEYMCRESGADGAIILSRNLEGLQLWRDAFRRFGIPVAHECLSIQGQTPLILHDMNRQLDAFHPDVAVLTDHINGSFGEDEEQARREFEARFQTVFRQNFIRRSRTAHGVDNNIDGPMKKPLLVSGDSLRAAAMRNCRALISDVLETSRPDQWTADMLRRKCEHWFDLANRGIYGPEWYEDEFLALAEDAALIERVRGVPVSVNRRYRMWTPEHTLMKVPPLLLEDQMDIFYHRLADLLARAEANFPSWGDTLEAMAYADIMTDGELRPWLDGCGRVAMTLVMWIARVLGAPLPLFAANREVHKMTYRDIDKHRLYFLECIRRANAECP